MTCLASLLHGDDENPRSDRVAVACLASDYARLLPQPAPARSTALLSGSRGAGALNLNRKLGAARDEGGDVARSGEPQAVFMCRDMRQGA